MLRQRARALAAGQYAADLAITALSLVLAHAVRDRLLVRWMPEAFAGPLYPLSHYVPLLALILVIWSVALWSVGFYGSRRTLPLREEVWGAARAVFFGTATLALAVYAVRWNDCSRPFLFLF